MQSRLAGLVISLLVSTAALCTPAAAAPVAISFETVPGADGVLGTADDAPIGYVGPLSNQYASVGLTFSQGTLFQDSFFDGNPNNHFISSTPPIGFFSVPVFGISVSSNSSWNATLTAYDAADNIIATVTAINPTAGWNRFSTTFGLSTTQAIHHFSIMDSSNPNHILNLDNLVFEVGAAEVPEPSQLALFSMGLLTLAQRFRRNKRG
ncbi:MAG TPA: PEP-CTERM sorting domain-containing protein [Noviherbaspirillum sp.]|nr:PEP-CTERM sorting domain-containing protein [Noviherbaspirillum sp.]